MLHLRSSVVLGLCLAIFSTEEASARTKLVYRKPNFFEQLFGVRPAQSINSAPSSNNQNWWQQQQQGGNGVRVIYGDPNAVKHSKHYAAATAVADQTDPQTIPGLGMGNLAYNPPLTQPIYDPTFAKLPNSTPDADAIRSLLSNKATNIRAIEVERKAILAAYSSRNFKPIWTENGQVTPRVADVMKLFASAGDDGLLTRNYQPEILKGFADTQAAVGTDADKLAKFDVELTAVALKYARQISGGQFEPGRLSLYNDIKPEYANADEVLRVLGSSPFPATYLQGLAPQNPQYGIFKAALAKLSDAGHAPVVQIAQGADVKRGKADGRIVALRSRLIELGFVAKDSPEPKDAKVLDNDLSIALMAMQTAYKLKPTGNFDDATLRALNTDHSAEQRAKLIDNMERVRWLPKDMGAKHVLVNEAAFEVNVMDHGTSIWKSRVVVGKPMTQTYAFSDQISSVVFNPTWGVPASIIVNEYGPKSRKDPGYLDRNGFKVIDAHGDEISSREVDWYNLGNAPTFGVQQPSGDGNALGELKFLFPNAHDIYMHDTPSKELFADSIRAYSHGCVRVQNPREFAQVLLGWDAAKVSANIKSNGKTKKNVDPIEIQAHSADVKPKIPVHLTYFTAWSDAQGNIQYYGDIYGRDEALQKAFAYDPSAPKQQSGADVVAQGTGAAKIDGGLIQN